MGNICQITYKYLYLSMELTSNDKIALFEQKAPLLFRVLIDDFGYELNQVKTIYLNRQKWAIHYIYTHTAKSLKIIIRQEPCYTDYGFSFFIYNLENGGHNILYHVEHHKQDKDLISLQQQGMSCLPLKRHLP